MDNGSIKCIKTFIRLTLDDYVNDANPPYHVRTHGTIAKILTRYFEILCSQGVMTAYDIEVYHQDDDLIAEVILGDSVANYHIKARTINKAPRRFRKRPRF